MSSDTVRGALNELGGDGPPLVFTHANGFPPEVYRVVLDEPVPDADDSLHALLPGVLRFIV